MVVEEEVESSTISIMTTTIPGSSDNPRNRPISPSPSPSPTWKLYENPHYSLFRPHNSKSRSSPYTTCSNSKSRSVLSASRSFMESHRHVSLSDLDKALAEIKELRSQLDLERRMRRKAEAMNKTLMSEKEAAEEKCRKLTDEMACVTRQKEKAAVEQVQMKQTEAKIKEMNSSTSTSNSSNNVNKINCDVVAVKKEVENPHIKRGIQGMEFPRAVLRSRGGGGGGSNFNGGSRSLPSSREGRSGGGLGSPSSSSSNLECQRAQLRVLMRHRSSSASSGLMMGAAAAAAHNNLVICRGRSRCMSNREAA